MLQPRSAPLLMNSNQEETSSLYTTSPHVGIHRGTTQIAWGLVSKAAKLGLTVSPGQLPGWAKKRNSSETALCDGFFLYNDYFGLHRMKLQMLRAQCLWTGGRFNNGSTEFTWVMHTSNYGADGHDLMFWSCSNWLPGRYEYKAQTCLISISHST